MQSKQELTPIAFMPGFICDAAILYGHQIKVFEKLGHPIILIDNTKAKTMFELADQTIAQIKEVSDKAHFVGLSAGGYDAFAVLKKNADICDKLVLLNTHARADDKPKIELRMKQFHDVEEGKFLEVTNKLYASMIPEEKHSDKELFDTCKAMAQKVGPEGFKNQILQMISREESLSLLPTIKQKTLIIAGDQDPFFPLPLLQEIKNSIISGGGQAQLLKIMGCGHLSTLERPEEVTNALVSFLSRNIIKDQPFARLV